MIVLDLHCSGTWPASLPLDETGKGECEATDTPRPVLTTSCFSFGADPYLSGEGAYETIMGMQGSGVQGLSLSSANCLHGTDDTVATAKHYINNEQEHFRDTSSSNVDDR